MISEDHVTLKTVVIMLKIHRNKLDLKIHSNRKTLYEIVIFHNITVMAAFVIK